MQYDKIFSYIEAGKQAGAKCVLGGEKRAGKGYFVDPTSKPSSAKNGCFASRCTDSDWPSFCRREARYENSTFPMALLFVLY